MAGAGYKLFNTGDVLSASDVNTYLMQQTVMSFASSAARTTALASVLAEGMVTYLQDTNVVEIYTGASWVSLDDPNAIQNSIVDAKGDIITATADNTPSRLAVGANNTVLTADSSTATGLKWATAGATLGATFNAYLSANQTVTSGVATKVQINTEEFDLGSCYDNATNYRFTPTNAGIYQVDLTIQGNGSSGTTIWLYKNGANIGELARTAGAGSPISGNRLVTMNGSTDYIEFYATVASGTTIYGGQATTIFGAAYLRSN